jgi:quinol monooxygenase YgiN
MCADPATGRRPGIVQEDLMGRFVIAVYRPKPGKHAALEAVVGKHLDVLRAEQLVTDRQPYAMRAKDGTILEVFEWRSAEAIEQAHANAAVQALWEEFGAACDYVPLASLPEAQEMFANFEPVSIKSTP